MLYLEKNPICNKYILDIHSQVQDVIKNKQGSLKEKQAKNNIPSMSVTDLQNMRLVDCFLAEELIPDFLQWNKVLTILELDARNSDTVCIKTFWEKVPNLYNNRNFVSKTMQYAHFHEKFSMSYTIYKPREDENKFSSDFVKSKFNKFRGRMLDMLRNYEASGNGWDNLRESSWREHKENLVFCGSRLTTDQQNNPSKYKFVTNDRYNFFLSWVEFRLRVFLDEDGRRGFTKRFLSSHGEK